MRDPIIMEAANELQTPDRRLDIHLAEYNNLKSEQAKRIGFRDNLLYVTLGAVGALCSYAMADPLHRPALLLVPWACFILGWTYLVNDQKISAIGRYLREELGPGIEALAGVSPVGLVFGWERAHRGDSERGQRKRFQLVVDLTAFCASSIGALLAFAYLEPNLDGPRLALVSAGGVLTVVLSGFIYSYADLRAD